MDKDVRKLVKALQAQGFTVAPTSKNHLVVTLGGSRVTTLPSTPSDPRSLRNAIAQCRRAGFVWPPTR